MSKFIRVSKLILLVFIVFSSALVGFALHAIVIQRTYRNPLIASWPQTELDLNSAASTLYNCYAFRPYRATLWSYFKKTSVGFSYSPVINAIDDSIYAVAIRLNKQIILTDLFFKQTRAMREQVLAHETMHLLGLPSHTKKLIRRQDLIYQLEAACYPDTASETLNDGPTK